MKKRNYLQLYKWSGEFVTDIVSWNEFTDKDIETRLKEYNADYAVTETKWSIS